MKDGVKLKSLGATAPTKFELYNKFGQKNLQHKTEVQQLSKIDKKA